MALIELKKEEYVMTLTINSPQNLNALSTELMNEMSDRLDVIEADRDIRALIITGAGKAFVAGADIKEMADFGPVEMMPWAYLGSRLNTKIEKMRMPVIAAINGYALGGGLEIALACDIRIASKKAKLGLPEASLGVNPGAGGTQRLPRTIGIAKAKELLFTGKIISADDALSIGLVNSVYEPEELMEKSMEMAKEIAANAPIAVSQLKKLINNGMEMDITSALELEHESVCLCYGTEDQKTGMHSFLDKSIEKKFIGK